MPRNWTATLPMTEVARPHRGESLLRNASTVLLGSLCVALAAHIAIPLPWTPVPLTMQPMAVLLVGLLGGPALGFATLCAYLAEGALGLPVFQPHGPGGLLQLAGPTGGFLLSYPLVAMVAGWLYRTLPLRSRYAAAALAGTAATALLFTAGATQFAFWTHSSLSTTLMAAVVPFLPGECAKVLAAAGIAAGWTAHTRR